MAKALAAWPADAAGAHAYAMGLRVGEGWAFRVSQDAAQPTAIASATAALLIGFVGQDHALTPMDRAAWADHLLAFQEADGLVDDATDYAQPTQPQPTWALRAHRTRHVAWAVECLAGRRLGRPLRFVEPCLQRDGLTRFLDALWQDMGSGGPWAWGNWVMDLGVLLDLQRRHFDDHRADDALGWLLGWLDAHLDPASGFWNPAGVDDRNAMAGAMHLYPLYWARGREVPHFERAVERTLALQQRDGLFAYEVGQGGSQCLDYDAVLVLINAWHRVPRLRPRIEAACRRTLEAIRAARNLDGSWADARVDEMRYWATRAAPFHASRGGLWDTYARLMTVAMCIEVLTGQPPAGVQSGRHLFELFRPVDEIHHA